MQNTNNNYDIIFLGLAQNCEKYLPFFFGKIDEISKKKNIKVFIGENGSNDYTFDVIQKKISTSNIYNFVEDRFFLFFLGIFLILAILLNQNLELNDVWIQFISAVSNSGINFTNNNHYSHFTFILITLSFFGGCLLSSSSGFKLARLLILFNKVYYELLKLLSPSVVINSSIFKSKEKIKINDFYSSALLLVFFLILFLLYSAVLSFEELSFKNSFKALFSFKFKS